MPWQQQAKHHRRDVEHWHQPAGPENETEPEHEEHITGDELQDALWKAPARRGCTGRKRLEVLPSVGVMLITLLGHVLGFYYNISIL
jgi:hypothetical protein